MECRNCLQNGYTQKLKKTVGQFSYKECGLNNVLLDYWQGYLCSRCSSSIFALPDPELAACLIAREILLSGYVLSGNQILFLRKLMKLSPAELASLLDIDLDQFECVEVDKAVLKKVDEVKLKTIISGYIALLLNKYQETISRTSGAYGSLRAEHKLAARTFEGRIFLYYKLC